MADEDNNQHGPPDGGGRGGGADHLSAEQIADLRGELERALERLERSLQLTKGSLKPVALDQTTFGRLSRMDALQNQGLARNLKDREEARLSQIGRAFRRLEEGTYGLCAGCGGRIAYGRLVVMPETPSCAGCSGR